ncbi:MAG TPA: hypothetical protein PK196_08310 [Methanoculleus sp.]|nr:hypothetical protein [Methanoculleus sp.]HRD26498.1 hypothetical protein [Methanoculleus sp.]
MKRKTGLRALSTLLAVMLVSVVVVSAVSAQDATGTPAVGGGEPALVVGDSMNVLIAGATSVSDIRASGIPEPEELNIPKGITRYDLVTFDHAALNKQVRGVLPSRSTARSTRPNCTGWILSRSTTASTRTRG